MFIFSNKMKIKRYVNLTLSLLLLARKGKAIKDRNGTRLKELLEYAGCTTDNGIYLGQGICLEEDYSKGEAPNLTETVVHGWFKTIYVHEVDDEKKTLTFEYMITMTWLDDRIKANFSNLEEEKGIKQNPASERIWKPIPVIKRLTDRKDYHDSIDVKKFSLSSKNINGIDSIEVLLSISGRITIYCNDWKLEKYPLDDQECQIQFFYQGTTVIHFILTKKNAKRRHKDLSHVSDGFEILVEFKKSNRTDVTIINLQLQRLFQPFFFKFYMPAMLIVCISGTGFLFPLSILPGRITLEVTQFLTLANLFIYQMVKFAFIFSTLLNH